MDYIKKGTKITFVLMLICGILYPLLITGIGKLAFNKQAEGSMITYKGKEVGSALIGQQLNGDQYFTSRPSAYNYNMVVEGDKTVASGSSNLGATNKALQERMEQDINTFLAKNPTVKKEDIPVDLMTQSASGLDPHISTKSALIQIPRIAEITGIDEEDLKTIVEKSTENKFLKGLNQEGVNVLKANIEIQTLLDEKR